MGLYIDSYSTVSRNTIIESGVRFPSLKITVRHVKTTSLFSRETMFVEWR